MATIQYDLSRNSVSFLNSNIVNPTRANFSDLQYNYQYTLDFSNFGTGHFEVYAHTPGTNQNFGFCFVQVIGGVCTAVRVQVSTNMNFVIVGGDLKIYTVNSPIINCCIIEKI